jgi:hypothetical protein
MKLQFFAVWGANFDAWNTLRLGVLDKKLGGGELFAEFAGHGSVALGYSTGIV